MDDLETMSAGARTTVPRTRSLPIWLRYGLGIGLVGAALMARLALDPFLGPAAHAYGTFYVAIALSAALLGLGPSLMVLVLGLFTCLVFIVPPRGALALHDLADVVEIFLYLFVTGTIVLLMHWLQTARAQAAANAQIAQERQLELEADIAARHRAEQALRESEQRLERLVKERTAKLQETVTELEHFSYALVHDMRAPLRAMRSYAGMLLESYPASQPEAHEFCQRIVKAAERLDLLICDSLNYAKVVREHPLVHLVELSPLLHGLLETYPELLPHRHRIQIVEPLPPVLGNEAALTQCFSHLVINAVKFVAPGTHPRVRIWGERRKDRVRITIEDNGIGIPGYARERLFGMFQRLSNDYEGTGIGLAIVKKVAERMGGHVGADSEPGKGSRFWVDLEAARGVVRHPAGPERVSALPAEIRTS